MSRTSFVRPALFICAFALFCLMQSRAVAQETTTTPPMVEIYGTQKITFHSSIVGRDYELDINLPRHYADTTRRFPVLFLLDSQWDFPLVNAVFGEQYYDGFVPEIVIVGIAAGGVAPNYDSLRALDLTPTRMAQQPQTGNGAKFLECIKKEVIPLIESKYRVRSDDRALMGSSLGGLFTLYAMFKETNLFSRYILTSPALQWDNGVLYTYEKEYAAKHTSLPVHLFIARGELEPIEAEMQKFADLLRSRKYEGLDFQAAVLEGMGHSGGKSIGYPRGLQFVYARPVVVLDPAQLDPFVGKYQFNPQIAVDIARDDKHLVLLTPDSLRIPLVASSGQDFFVKGVYLFIHFDKDPSGTVKGASIEQFGGSGYIQKVR